MVYHSYNSGFKHVCLFVDTSDKMTKSAPSWFFIFVLFLILVGIIVAFGKESYRNYQLSKEVADFKGEIEILKKKNEILSNLLDYFSSEKSLEKEARLKLNLVREGEKLVVISPQEKINAENQFSEGVQKKHFSNFRKWLAYLFDKDLIK